MVNKLCPIRQHKKLCAQCSDFELSALLGLDSFNDTLLIIQNIASSQHFLRLLISFLENTASFWLICPIKAALYGIDQASQMSLV